MLKQTNNTSLNNIIDDLIQIITKIELDNSNYIHKEIKHDLANVVAEYQNTNKHKIISYIKEEINNFEGV